MMYELSRDYYNIDMPTDSTVSTRWDICFDFYNAT